MVMVKNGITDSRYPVFQNIAVVIVHIFLGLVYLVHEQIFSFLFVERIITIGRNTEEQIVPHAGSKAMKESNRNKSLFASIHKPTIDNGRSSSMIIKKAHTVIPAHIVAEAISTVHGLDLRWSGPITPTETQYVEQYVLAKYPQHAGLVGGEKIDLSSLCISEEPVEPTLIDRRKSPRGSVRDPSPPSFGSNHPDLIGPSWSIQGCLTFSPRNLPFL
ncbi:hypothetical protein SO802_020059 [Lithocarpus litseifolius]|uniref:Uncharacterized protein n=1 Tax=Lithocarpus litseifolius TaxID=425828 RepID=A0AAW2CD30_9ROSI